MGDFAKASPRDSQSAQAVSHVPLHEKWCHEKNDDCGRWLTSAWSFCRSPFSAATPGAKAPLKWATSQRPPRAILKVPRQFFMCHFLKNGVTRKTTTAAGGSHRRGHYAVVRFRLRRL